MKADWFVPALAAHLPALAAAYGIERRIDANGVALTFDDGPHAEGTPAVLDTLARAGATATFFLVGEQVRRRPALAREIADAGHEIALHGDRHTLLLRRSVRELHVDLERAAVTIEHATGRAPTLYRPPYGVFSSGALALVRELGYRPLLWSTWGRDWERRATPASIARRATRRLAPGDVVLLHDSDAYSSVGSWMRTAAALPSVLEALATLGVSSVAVTQST
ncbi:MAG TPA: polysaccharide deacetylase family protein [Gaiellaceae bacterium]|nr:polysaccharide deacetylase family protein [Gaiellaceae bacterium]